MFIWKYNLFNGIVMEQMADLLINNKKIGEKTPDNILIFVSQCEGLVFYSFSCHCKKNN